MDEFQLKHFAQLPFLKVNYICNKWFASFRARYDNCTMIQFQVA